MADMNASMGKSGSGLGPVGLACSEIPFTHVFLLSDHDKSIDDSYSKWLRTKTEATVQVVRHSLTSPTRYNEIFEAARSSIDKVKQDFSGESLQITYHLSSGTPAMAAVWIILAKTSHPAELIESSPQAGVQTVSFPFDLAADYVPEIKSPVDDEIIRLTQGLPPESPKFDYIIHKCNAMKRLVAQARRVAIHDVPVLIQGESGTGKELFARAIHASSSRKDGQFVPVNCGAIPSELVESEFFGHIKGAFTGAVKDRTGYLETADKGTLFLDEIGELPLHAQVKLLRALQDGVVKKIGSDKGSKINVRIIAATNRNLSEEVGEGSFREDLFHRLAVAILQLPPLRERKGDLNLLIDCIAKSMNAEFSMKPGWKDKQISAGARNLMLQHTWPGNIRELHNTLSRVFIWSTATSISTEDMREAILPIHNSDDTHSSLLNQDIGKGVDLEEIIAYTAKHYIERALEAAGGNKTKATKLLGLANYQTLSNWMKKYL